MKSRELKNLGIPAGELLALARRAAENARKSGLENACKLPVAVRGALMPDAHRGYGLPIGGVLATLNAVIPYAVGVDIACRMKMSVLDLPASKLEDNADRPKRTIEKETRFGIGASFKRRLRVTARWVSYRARWLPQRTSCAAKATRSRVASAKWGRNATPRYY